MNLNKISTRAPEDLSKEDGKAALARLHEELDELQYKLYADGRFAVLVVLQGLDASGKDGLIRRAFTSMNPQGVSVKSFKVPTPEEAAHDFLWRIHAHTPARGNIRIFNRSHYEDVLVPVVNGWIDESTTSKRYEAINNFEQLLIDNGTRIIKCYLHASEEEQIERQQERLSDPRKAWKYSADDKEVMKQRADYVAAYEKAFKHCSVAAPWHIIPADQNWYKALKMATLLRDTLVELPLVFPGLQKEKS